MELHGPKEIQDMAGKKLGLQILWTLKLNEFNLLL